MIKLISQNESYVFPSETSLPKAACVGRLENSSTRRIRLHCRDSWCHLLSHDIAFSNLCSVILKTGITNSGKKGVKAY